MSSQTIHLLHLHGGGLNWLRTEQDGRQLFIRDAGRIEAAPREALDRWCSQPRKPQDIIRIHDSRPRYYSITLQMPATGLKQLESAIRLRIRQELGVDSAELAWTARVRRGEQDKVLVEATVARRETLAEIEAWRAAHKLENVWVGADLSAIHDLARVSRERSALVVNGEQGGATLYRVHPEIPVQRARVGLDDKAAKLPAEFEHGDAEGATRLWQYGEPVDWLTRHLPELGAGEPCDPPQLYALNGNSPTQLTLAEGGPKPGDAVLAGAVAMLLGRTCAPGRLRSADAGAETRVPSLLPAQQDESFTEALARGRSAMPGLTTRKLVAVCVVLAVALAGALAARHVVHAGAMEDLQARSRSLATATEIYRAQDTQLNAIMAKRGPLLAVFEAIHEASPGGITLASIDIGAGGSLKINGKAQGADKADQFFRGLAASPLLESVVMPEVVPNDREVEFEIVGMIAERRSADRRRRL